MIIFKRNIGNYYVEILKNADVLKKYDALIAVILADYAKLYNCMIVLFYDIMGYI